MKWIGVFVLSLGLVGCGSVGYSASDYDVLAPDAAVSADDGIVVGLDIDQGRSISRTGSVTVDVGDEKEASSKILRMAKKFDALVFSFSDRSVTLDLHASRLTALLEALDSTDDWEVESWDIAAYEMTSGYFDVVARLKTTKEVKARIEKLLDKATTISEILKIEKEIEKVQQRIDQYEASKRDAELRAGRVQITVELD